MAQTGVAGTLNGGGDGYGATGERGSRRKKLAGYLKAANELRQSYRDAYITRDDPSGEMHQDDQGIPGAFPDLVVARSGTEEMVLFPSYARRHVKREKPKTPSHTAPATSQDGSDTTAAGDAEYWRKEWEIFEDANAVADVDVRGWIYSPHTGPMTRKNRLLFGIARHLSGIPAPTSRSQTPSRASSVHRDRAAEREEEMVHEEAERISQRGRREADVAGRGGYSEGIGQKTDRSSLYNQTAESRSPSPRIGHPHPGDFPHPLTDSSLDSNQIDGPSLSGPVKRVSWNHPTDMSPAELVIANNHLMARLKPFLTDPSVSMPLTIFFYNDHTSQSRTTHTNEAGHFNFRAALDFIPSHVKILAASNLSATEEVRIIEPKGVSLISDIDDTIKHSAIGSGAKEIFRNTFIRELGDLTVEGVKEWYNKMSDMGVSLHYVSNAPWQLYPVLVSYFALAGLPPGSFHLKQYTGMLQGIFEPVAERKKGTLNRIMNDFPDRRFILVGDSGEADLELYTEVVLANPGRILGVFIRDVTTAPNKGFFDSSMGPLSGGGIKSPLQSRPDISGGRLPNRVAKTSELRPSLPPRPKTGLPVKHKLEMNSPIMGDLISFDDDEIEAKSPPRSNTDPAKDPYQRTSEPAPSKSPPPIRPDKPLAFRSQSTDSASKLDPITAPLVSGRKGPAYPPKPRKFSASQENTQPPDPSPLSQTQIASPPSDRANSLERQGYRSAVKNKVASAYNALPSPAQYWHGTSQTPQINQTSAVGRPGGDSARGLSAESAARSGPAVPPRTNLASYPVAAAQYATNQLGFGGGGGGDDPGLSPASPMNKKEELWKRRWARAKDVLDEKEVMLRAWRVGDDVQEDAIRMIERAMKEDRGEIGRKVEG